MKFLWLHTKPTGKKQNIDCSFYAVLEDGLNKYETSIEYCEPGEVESIKWIPIKDLHKYDFAFNQANKIMRIYKKYINCSTFTKCIIDILNWFNKKYLFKPFRYV